MPQSKDALARYRIIDRELRRWTPVKTSRLVEVCSEKLGKPVTPRLIQTDIKDMIEDTSLEIYAPILYDRKAKAYYYEKGAPL